MTFQTTISSHSWSVLIWYSMVVICCFVLSYLMAGPYYLVQHCEDGWHFFDQAICGQGIRPFVVQMNAETLDSRVYSLLPPLSYTEGVGWHLMGTDVLGRDVFAGILYGGQRSLMIGFLSGSLAMVIGWFLGIWSVYVRWYRFRFSFFWIMAIIVIALAIFSGMYALLLLVLSAIVFRLLINRKREDNRKSSSIPWMWGRWIEWYQALPDLLLILVLSAAIGVLHVWGLVLIITAVVWPSLALIARRVATEVSHQPYFQQALRNNVSGKNLVLHYLWGNTRSVFRALFPLVVARIILLESTISFLGMGLPPDVVTIGSMVSAARFNLSSWWLIVFSCLFIFILVYPLMLLGRRKVRHNYSGIISGK